MLDDEGNSAQPRGRRGGKEVSQSTRRGKAATQTSWLMHELTLLRELRSLGQQPKGPFALEAHIERVSQYFERVGVSADPNELAERLWSKPMPEQEPWFP